MDVDIVFDICCPWCYVGCRRLDQALAHRPGITPRRAWRPFLLNPDMPAEGISRHDYLARKFGNPSRVERMESAVSAAAHGAGLEIDLAAIERTPNTVLAHRLIRLAPEGAPRDSLVGALFTAYFARGVDLGDRQRLLKVAEEVGLDPAPLAQGLDGEAELAQVFSENARAHRLGVNGVPCFVFNQGLAISGAQEPEVLGCLIDTALEAETEATLSLRQT
ncbi:DsbA family oxidoreductase [Roseospirillum parvum]|uniref:Predicted dithiol-disulfide isomerase, DsbA family n=1 Tax=Roseospirillum parvum TaxID=83401 RepID=A0A1G7Y410_9PROT|nr:DsbA family oxidoreductase [Roseospirillum parvum]SDG91087.1 Predicted dithiol-disulfide isomerase, DsbA family [Roseospirillum parvum]